MAHPYRDFEPSWYHGKVPADSYRSIFKWGVPDAIKAPRESLYKLMKVQFDLTDDDFKDYSENLGLDPVRFDIPIGLTETQLAGFAEIVGKDYLRTDDYARLSVAYGKTMYDLLRIRNKIVENVPDAVLYPDSKEQIERIVARCAEWKIPLYVYGGGSSVTRGVE
ncbi:MAG: FAD-binding oxidoreductase, partial [Spirochaetaceae bacterium]|nr:FAD-binding oxidoreductase [Spirochaetaceae bacterium]